MSLTSDTVAGIAPATLDAVTLLALLIAAGLVIALVRSTGNTRRAQRETARLRRIYEPPRRWAAGGSWLPEYGLPPRQPMRRPGPPAEPTVAFAAPDDTTQPMRIDRSAK